MFQEETIIDLPLSTKSIPYGKGEKCCLNRDYHLSNELYKLPKPPRWFKKWISLECYILESIH